MPLPLLRPRLTLTRPATRSRRAAARRAVLAGLAAVVAANLGLGLAAERYPRVRDPMFGDKLAKLQKRHAPGRPLAVVVGTSRAGLGVHGAVAERVYSERAGSSATVFNLGVPGTGPVGHLVHLHRLLDTGPTPDLVLIEVLPSTLANRPVPVECPLLPADRLTFREVQLVERFGFPPEQTRPAWRHSTLLPWHGLRCQLLGRAVQSWLPYHLRHDWGREADAHGWGTALKDTATPEERAAGAVRAKAEYAALLADLHPGGPAADALREMLAVCRERGVPVQLLRMPEATDFRAHTPPVVERRLTAFLDGLGVEVIDARGWVPDDRFTDGHHLLRPGAERFSERLAAEVLVPALAGGRR